MKNKYHLVVLLLCASLQLNLTLSDSPFKFKEVSELYDFFKWTPNKANWISAHRGGPETNYPENCIATFEHTCKQIPAIIECDIASSKDGQLLLMHDYSLDRTTNGSGKVNERNWEYIKGLKLKDNEGNLTQFLVPTLKETLDWTKGKSILMLDVKRSVSFEQVIDEVKKNKAEPYVVVITYSVEDAKKVNQLAPELMISVTARNEEEVERLLATGIPPNRMVAFTGTKKSSKSVYQSLHDLGIFCIMGTMGNYDNKAVTKGKKVYESLLKSGVDILSTDHPAFAYESF